MLSNISQSEKDQHHTISLSGGRGSSPVPQGEALRRAGVGGVECRWGEKGTSIIFSTIKIHFKNNTNKVLWKAINKSVKIIQTMFSKPKGIKLEINIDRNLGNSQIYRNFIKYF